jgi:hypothetical protein
MLILSANSSLMQSHHRRSGRRLKRPPIGASGATAIFETGRSTPRVLDGKPGVAGVCGYAVPPKPFASALGKAHMSWQIWENNWPQNSGGWNVEWNSVNVHVKLG